MRAKCPYCGKQVEYLYVEGGGVLPSPDYVLIADWVYHAACWDKQVDPDIHPGSKEKMVPTHNNH
jgi:hypothetical protein